MLVISLGMLMAATSQHLIASISKRRQLLGDFAYDTPHIGAIPPKA